VFRELAMLVGEHQNMIAEDNKEIAQLLTVTGPIASAFVCVDVGITPQCQKASATKLG